MAGVPECCKTGFLWEGEPTGTEEKIGGVDTYVARPPTATDRYVIIWTDIFGYKIVNVRIIADTIAKSGVNVIVPDILLGDPIDKKRLNYKLMDKPVTYWDRLWQVGSLVTLLPTVIPWIAKHGDSQTLPVINAVLEDVKVNLKASKIGVVGYCFGGRYSILHGADSEPRVDAYANCHPSNVSVPKDFEALSSKKPGIFCLAAYDGNFSEATVKALKAIAEKKSLDIIFKEYPGTTHGFAARGDDLNEDIRKARDACLADLCQFIHAKL
ncbi:hypothetical protein HK101_011680 [Irineochytrium annulatum]|nr:hypothetical protein HK101_011680 [Irineochytrium annulatum]